jgi:citrate/tricarballylate utilization protein
LATADRRLETTIVDGQHVMTVCNACRYCEAYCPVFQAMENRTAFAKGDILYLANLCHNCGECLYACQYAPPHEFGINVPRVLAEARVASYEEYCWPSFMSGAFRRSQTWVSLALAAAAMLLLWGVVRSADARSDFYAVIPHDLLVGIFGVAGLFVAVALAVGFRRATKSFGPSRGGHYLRMLRDVLTLRHLHATGADCTSDVEVRTPWRRYFHHCTFYGFALCFASTTVAAVYHTIFGWFAPYAVVSLPVILGVAGGIGLVVGPLGLLAQRARRDPALGDPEQRGMDASFIVMLLMTSITGLLLLALRDRVSMPALLVIHLGFVLGLFLTLPYGKFVHGIYRTAALLKFSTEASR